MGNDPINMIDPTGQAGEMALRGLSGFIAMDMAIPEPSDVAWPKWAGYAVGATVLGGVVWATSESTTEGTRALGDLEPIHDSDHPQNDAGIKELSDEELEEAIKNPSEGDKVTVRGNKVLDGNTRINEAKGRGWEDDTEIPVIELPELPDNIDDDPLGPYGR